jgi:hypothetical protein
LLEDSVNMKGPQALLAMKMCTADKSDTMTF